MGHWNRCSGVTLARLQALQCSSHGCLDWRALEAYVLKRRLVLPKLTPEQSPVLELVLQYEAW